MAQTDLEVFIRERGTAFDETLDVTPGSPFDVQVVQPIVRRLGTDPFTVNFQLFAQDRLNQDFPDLATKEGDAIADLLIKTSDILWAPFKREAQRIANNISFRDPTILTLDEAEALGANLFSERNRGTFSRGQSRIYFAQPQSISVSPANFVTTKGGLHFFPDSIQSIRVDEMLLNVEGTLYYFDINVIAEKPGDQYNIGPDEIVTIANITSAVRITNKRRFRFGNPDETAVAFVDRIQQELSERSLVTLRGIGAQLTKTFPEVTRLGVVGFNDPEMQRDVIKGGGFGPILSFGFAASPVPDGENMSRTRRLNMATDGVDFTALIGSTGTVPGNVFYITLIDGFGGDAPRVRDLTVQRIVSATQIDVVEQDIFIGALSSYTWMLRKKEITISGIPGGILFPDGVNGTVSVPDGQVHIGGATDVYIRGTDFDTSSLLIDAVVDDSPILAGTQLQIQDSNGHVVLDDFVLSTDYQVDDAVYTALQDAKTRGFSIQIITGAAAGSYRVINVSQPLFSSPILTLDPAPLAILATDFRWRLLDEIDLDLIEPKETRIGASDGTAIQGVDFFESASSIDFQAIGVAPNDILRILNGAVAGDYTISAVLAPFYTRVQLDRQFTNSVSNLQYVIFRPNSAGGVIRPFVRVTSVELLDTSGQPVGSTIPYALPVDIRSRAFANVATGIKVDVRDIRLGIVSLSKPTGFNLTGLSLTLNWEDSGGPQTQVVTFSGSNPVLATTAVTQINTALNKVVAFVVDGSRIGITNIGGETQVTAGTARTELFGDTEQRSTKDIRSDVVNNAGGWGLVKPEVDEELDVFQVLDGFQIGFYDNPHTVVGVSALQTDRNFSPEVGRHVQLGSRSIGTARLYFLEPTTIEFDSDSRLSVTLDNGISLNFKPDPGNDIQKVPGLPSGVKPTDGVVSSSTVFASASTDFVRKGILPGDELVIDYIPLRGTVVLADPVPNLALATLVLSVDGGTDKVITYINDSLSIPTTHVSRAGVADQINKAVGRTICSIVNVGSNNFLEFQFDGSVVVRRTGTANTLLGFSAIADQNNDSPNKGVYAISVVATNQLTIVGPPTFGTNQSNQGFKVFRPGGQRISATQMASNKAEAGLFYFDLELVSEGTGNLWNIAADLKMTAIGFDSDGYYLTTDDSNLSFSPVEKARLHLSKSFLDIGVSDDPENATQLSGQNIQVNYERSTLTGNVNNFLTAESERVINESPLARHLTPKFVRFDLLYLNGSKEGVIIPEVEKLIKGIFPGDPLEVSDVEKVFLDKGASSIQNPLELIAAVHNPDRSIELERSKNALNIGRLSAFIPDVLNITRGIS
jgi:hypothetical protein